MVVIEVDNHAQDYYIWVILNKVNFEYLPNYNLFIIESR